MDYVVGDVVRLKSGGPLMTVRMVRTSPPGVNTVWFNDKGELQRDFLSDGIFEKVPVVEFCLPGTHGLGKEMKTNEERLWQPVPQV